MVRSETTFLTAPSCAASVNGPRARAADAHRLFFTVRTLLYKPHIQLFRRVRTQDQQCSAQVIWIWEFCLRDRGIS